MNRTKFITRTAIMIALAIVAQMLRLIIPTAPTLLIGSLVNAMLLIAVGLVGVWGGVIIALITPIVAFLQGGPAAASLVFIPCIMLGNLAIVLLFALFYKEKSLTRGIIGAAAGSVAKFVVLYVLMVLLAIPAFAPPMAVTVLSTAFGLSQLATAAIGSVIALVVLALLKRTGIDKKDNA